MSLESEGSKIPWFTGFDITCTQVFLLTGVTRNGLGGAGVALAVEVEVRLAYVYATILPHKMVERSAADLANLQKHGDAIHMGAQVYLVSEGI